MTAIGNLISFLGECESCRAALHEGDLGFHHSDGVIVCENCAPTYAEADRGFEAQAFEFPEDYRHFCARMKNHLAGGGSMSDKYLVSL